MTNEKLDKLNLYKRLIHDAQYMITNGRVHDDSINYLFLHDEDFKQELYDLRNKYYKKYTTLFEEA